MYICTTFMKVVAAKLCKKYVIVKFFRYKITHKMFFIYQIISVLCAHK